MDNWDKQLVKKTQTRQIRHVPMTQGRKKKVARSLTWQSIGSTSELGLGAIVLVIWNHSSGKVLTVERNGNGDERIG